MNKVTLIGTITRSPEFRNNNGLDILEMTVGGERREGDKSFPFYGRVNVLGKRVASIQSAGLAQGDAVLVEGTLEQNSWETEGGEKRSALRIKGMNVQKLSGNFETEQDQSGGLRMKGGRNLVQLSGHLGQDAEVRQTDKGAVADLRLAVTESWTDKDGERQEKTHWVTVTVWRELAERAESMRKGTPVYIEGALVNDSWTDKEGNKRNTQKVEACDLQVLQRFSKPADSKPSGSARPEVVRSAASQGAEGAAPSDEDMPF
ncbi:single-strand binding protein (plasmid) [Deinococcus proteolyticus MRP]|uniref:Single-stranded DNA-binding protein n=1 Tax=Deinococcus proteolyticus (strain ATCC 35074 / DSM 20540 / JCM 6276 / NBRC 101906 / NCIMB 13154 / VKM Ac-1939 / CCM 2703 / MRP) TaxID=693977 RepID=F0RQ78_DEIPM|nr:single-stranded DNA-binding protein [Deinococcus proteolyticus]ADY27437.1 single-strand binding protein [Deinococcus proteolyticus MRP]